MSHQSIFCDLRRPTLAVFRQEGAGGGGAPLPNHEYQRIMRAPGGGTGRPGQRAFFVGHVSPAPGGPAAHPGLGLYLQDRGLCMAETKPQVRGLVLRPGLLDEGQRGGVPAGDQRPSQAAGGQRPPVHHFPHPGTQPETGRGTGEDRGPHGGRTPCGAVCPAVTARLGRVGERGGALGGPLGHFVPNWR